MTNLPIMPSTAQISAVSKQASAQADANESQGGQPFGAVLARQINDAPDKDAINRVAVATSQSGSTAENSQIAADVLSLLGLDAKTGKQTTANDTEQKTDASTADNSGILPAEMLSALLPQVMQGAAQAANTQSKSQSDAEPGINSKVGSDLGKTSLPQMKNDAITAANPSTVTAAKLEQQPVLPEEQAQNFTAKLGNALRQTEADPSGLKSMKPEALSAAATQQADLPPLTQTLQVNASNQAALQQTAAALSASGIQPVQAAISTPVGQDRWKDDLGQKITLISTAGKDQTAELQLNPPDLGPLNVVLKISGEHATALFTSPHAAVREAVEQAIPRLRDMMADNGIMLGNTTVSDQTPRDQGQANSQFSSPSAFNTPQDSTPATAPVTTRVSPIARHNGIVDTFV